MLFFKEVIILHTIVSEKLDFLDSFTIEARDTINVCENKKNVGKKAIVF